MNTTFKRILYITAMVLASFTLVLALAGVIGAWVLRSELHQTLDVVSQLSVTALQRAHNGVARIDPPLARAQTAVQNAKAKVRESGQKLKDTNLIIAGAERLFNQDLSTEVNTLTTTLIAASDTLQAADDALNAISRLPFVRGDTGVVSQAREVIDEMQAIEQNVVDVRQALRTRKEEAIQTVVATLIEPLEKLDARLTQLSTRSVNIQTRLRAAETRVPLLIDQGKTIITIIVVVVTLGLLWTILSQLIVIKFSFERFKAASKS